MVKHPSDWSWSSYKAMTGEATSLVWLATDGFLALFSTHREAAIKSYIEFVTQGAGQESIWRELKRQIFLGDDNFVLQVQEKIKSKSEDVNFPKAAQRRAPALSLLEYQKSHACRNDAIVSAYAIGEYSYQEITDFFNLHFTIVGKIVRATRKKR